MTRPRFPHPPARPGARRRARGLMLIEVLVSILIFSLGLLSLAGLQIVSLRYQKDSRSLESVAAAIANIAERVRTNPAGARSDSYSYTATYAVAKGDTRAVDGCAADGTCDSTQMAANDIAAWLQAARQSLPGGAVNLVKTNRSYVATVMWMDKDNTTANAAALVTAPVCAGSETGAAWRNCCPAAVAAPAGVRCLRTFFLP